MRVLKLAELAISSADIRQYPRLKFCQTRIGIQFPPNHLVRHVELVKRATIVAPLKRVETIAAQRIQLEPFGSSLGLITSLCCHFSSLLLSLRGSLLFGGRSAGEAFACGGEFCGSVGTLAFDLRVLLFLPRVLSFLFSLFLRFFRGHLMRLRFFSRDLFGHETCACFFRERMRECCVSSRFRKRIDRHASRYQHKQRDQN